MNDSSNPPHAEGGSGHREQPASSQTANLTPIAVLSLLEADQVVAAKQQTRFGPRNLSLGLRALLWGLRVYVLVMLVIVVISVVRATHASP